MMSRVYDLREVSSFASSKKINRCRSFHFRYLELCRSKNVTPLPDIRSKNNATSILSFHCDKLSVNDWLLVIEALHFDQVLQTISIRMRKHGGIVLEHIDTERKAKLFKHKPPIYTKFVFAGLVDAISNCINFNKTLVTVNLEGLPLNENYVESIAKALAANETIKEISFQGSNIGDRGCEVVCSTIKYMENIEKLNLSECQLTEKGAESVAAMIKTQKISRYTEGWQKSLRYRDVDPDTMPGLRAISVARNPKIGDDGVKAIVEVLKEDVWVKVIDMEGCGLTDRAANLILDCLELNNYINDFNVRNNPEMSKFLQRSIRQQLGKEEDDQKTAELQAQLTPGGKKITIAQLKEKMRTLEKQLAFERLLRQKAEQLNEKLNKQILAYESQMEEDAECHLPEGYVIVKNQSLQTIINNTNVSTHGLNDFPPKDAPVPTPTPRVAHKSLRNKLLYCQRSQRTSYAMPPAEPTNTPRPSVPIARKPLKVRKVKSEMKYVEPPPKTANKKKESKSDHEFANEADFKMSLVHFETNIGDTVVPNTVKTPKPPQIPTPHVKAHKSGRSEKNLNVRFEVDGLSMASMSDDIASTDSETLRNNFRPMKVFITRATPQQLQQRKQQFQGDGLHDDDLHATGQSDNQSQDKDKQDMPPMQQDELKQELHKELNQELTQLFRQDQEKAEGGNQKKQSPRSLFLGLSND